MKLTIIRKCIYVCLLTGFFTGVHAQNEQPALTATILHLDSAFWNAYNTCDSAHFEDFLTDDIEFYHDKGGVTLGAKALSESIKKNICGVANYHLRREAVAGTVHVYPMQKGDETYGALITGQHVFYITTTGKPEFLDGAADFSQLWILKNGVWKMSRILSYNHHGAEPKNARTPVKVTALQLKALTGSYSSAKSGTMIVVAAGDSVLLLKGGNNTFTLFPSTAQSFFTKERDLVFNFTMDAKGKPVKMEVVEKGSVADVLMFEK